MLGFPLVMGDHFIEDLIEGRGCAYHCDERMTPLWVKFGRMYFKNHWWTEQTETPNVWDVADAVCQPPTKRLIEYCTRLDRLYTVPGVQPVKRRRTDLDVPAGQDGLET